LSRALAAEISRLGGNPADDVWQWLLLNGPHGPSFTWSQTRRAPPGYVGVEHLQSIVADRGRDDPTFQMRVQAVLDAALSSDDPDVLRRAVQVAAVLGGELELKRVLTFTAHENASLAADARASAFYLRKRIKHRG
jgi:hypothetical protein